MSDTPKPDPTCTDCLPENAASASAQTATVSAKQDEDAEDPSTFKPLDRAIGPAVTIEYCDGVSLFNLSSHPTEPGLTFASLLAVPLGSSSILDRHRTIPHLPLANNHQHHTHPGRRTPRSVPRLATDPRGRFRSINVGSEEGGWVPRVEGVEAEDTQCGTAQAGPGTFGQGQVVGSR